MKRLIILSLILFTRTASGQQILREISWSELQNQGRLEAGQVIEPENTTAFTQLKVQNPESGAKSFEVLTISDPGITAARYALSGMVHYGNIEGAGYLEMWNHFPDGSKFFSRTLGGSGPMQSLQGSSDWRPFILPFQMDEAVDEPPTRLEFNIVLPGRGTVYLGPLQLVQYKAVQETVSTTAKAREPFIVRLDSRGPYLILSTQAASRQYENALAEARQLHPDATEAVFAPEDFTELRSVLQEHRPRYTLVFILPQELDVNFVCRWLKLTTELDDDPFVDVRTGFITGSNPDIAAHFVRRIRDVVEGRLKLPGAVMDNLGPNYMAPESAFYKQSGSFMIPVLSERLGVGTISHGKQGFTEKRLEEMHGAGVIHFGGHGYPDGIVDGLKGMKVPRLKLSPCVAFNGACYTGVTSRWFDVACGPTIREKTIEPSDSFCLGLLANNTVGYIAALHADHGIPVYQEMEHMAVTGASLGEVIKYTHDGVILASGGKLPKFEVLSNAMPRLQWSASEFMRKGTAARALFGDPALVITEAFTEPPFLITTKRDPNGILRITASLENNMLRSTFCDTYHSDLSSDKRQFNDRALVVCDLPKGWDGLASVKVVRAQTPAGPIRYRLVGYGTE